MLENESVQDTNTAAPAEAAPAPETPVTDIDGLSEFTFQGEKYTPERLHKMFNEHQTYATQVKEFGDHKKYYDNLDVDLESVLKDPNLADKFRQTYPKSFHGLLDKLLGTRRQDQAPSQTAQPSLPKELLTEFEQMKGRLNYHEQRAYQAEVQAANAKIDAILPPLFKKYEMANEDQVFTRAEGILAGGQKLTEKTWERIVRESHEVAAKKADQYHGAKLKTQLEKGQRGQDVGPGGATPGQAPQKPRTFAEAQEAMIASMQSQKSG